MYKSFYDLPKQLQEDLVAWYNCAVFDQEVDDKEEALAMVDMVNNGQFEAWNCPDCGERVYFGQPDDWSLFQGVNQADYTSYPGNAERNQYEYIRQQCDDCRSRG